MSMAQALPDGKIDPMEVDRENPLSVWLDAIQPSDPHRALADRAGTWTIVFRSWYAPDQDPTDVAGIAERTMILDGRVLEEEVTLPLPGRKYEGMSHIGYDKVSERYWWQRLDNMSTWITRSNDSSRGEEGEITFEVPVLDHASGEESVARVVLRTEPDREVQEWYQTGPDGEPFKSIEYIYTRMPEPADEAAESEASDEASTESES